MAPRDFDVKNLILVLTILLGSVSLVSSQGTDEELNNTCETAQVFEPVALPFTVTGSLDTPPTTPDIDFFMFTGTPNSVVIVDYEGQPTEQGTLRDPLLGLFDSQCNRISSDDDSGVGLNSRLGFTVPADGVFILAATSFPDFDFNGDGNSSGTYRLTLSPGGIIRGTVADTQGNPRFPNFVAAFTPAGEFVARATTSCCPNNQLIYELPLPVGSYRVVAQGIIARVWHRDKPTFAQADDITVAIDEIVTGINFTLPEGVAVEPQLNRSDFIPGDTLTLDLRVRNLSASQASIVGIVFANIPAEPEIDQSTFCCFRDPFVLFQGANLPIAPNTDIVVRNFFTHQFTGGEPAGSYDICVRVFQLGRETRFSCTSFTFTP